MLTFALEVDHEAGVAVAADECAWLRPRVRQLQAAAAYRRRVTAVRAVTRRHRLRAEHADVIRQVRDWRYEACSMTDKESTASVGYKLFLQSVSSKHSNDIATGLYLLDVNYLIYATLNPRQMQA